MYTCIFIRMIHGVHITHAIIYYINVGEHFSQTILMLLRYVLLIFVTKKKKNKREYTIKRIVIIFKFSLRGRERRRKKEIVWSTSLNNIVRDSVLFRFDRFNTGAITRVHHRVITRYSKMYRFNSRSQRCVIIFGLVRIRCTLSIRTFTTEKEEEKKKTVYLWLKDAQQSCPCYKYILCYSRVRCVERPLNRTVY
jgi:hypothetical protein